MSYQNSAPRVSYIFAFCTHLYNATLVFVRGQTGGIFGYRIIAKNETQIFQRQRFRSNNFYAHQVSPHYYGENPTQSICDFENTKSRMKNATCSRYTSVKVSKQLRDTRKTSFPAYYSLRTQYNTP